MAQQTIRIGSAPNDKTGDPLRTAFAKVNANFTELYAGGASETQLTNGSYTLTLGATGKLTLPNNSTFDGQTLVDITAGTNYSLKVAHGTTGSVFAIGTGTEGFGVANDSLNHTGTGYVPYNATASTMSFNVPGYAGSLTINGAGVVTVPNGLVISGTGNLTFPDATTTTGKSITIPTDNSLTVNLSNSSPSTNTTFKINPLSIKLPTGNGAIFSGVDGDVAYLWALDAGNKTLYFPDAGDSVSPQIRYSTSGGDGMQLFTASKPIKITTSAKNWSFNTNGSLTFPDASVQTTAYTGIIPNGTKASNAAGTTGQISYDASYIYICTATNTWKRSPLTGGY